MLCAHTQTAHQGQGENGGSPSVAEGGRDKVKLYWTVCLYCRTCEFSIEGVHTVSDP